MSNQNPARMQTRRYPLSCISGNCGNCGDECKGCPDKERLDEFKRWVAEHAAVQEDPIWCPLYYTATR